MRRACSSRPCCAIPSCEGVVIGYTTDYAGRKTGEIKAPVSGLVTFIRGVPSMWQGATLANVSPVLPSPPPYKKPT